MCVNNQVWEGRQIREEASFFNGKPGDAEAPHRKTRGSSENISGKRKKITESID